jgi:tetratricopeptide (TPR) repeat protein
MRCHAKYLLAGALYFLACISSLPGAVGSQGARQGPASADAFQRGLAALQENRLEDAFVELSTAEKERPTDARVRNFRGILLARMGRNAEAASEYQEATRLDPLLEDAYRNLGFLRWTDHQSGPARESLERAIKLSPNDAFAHYYLARVELDAGHYEPAFRELELSHQPWPAEFGFLTQAATGYVALGRTEDARKTLKQLVGLPLNAEQSLQLASLLLSVHESDSAIGLVKKLNTDSQLAPQESAGKSPAHAAWAEFDLSLVYLLAGNYEKAAEQAHVHNGDAPDSQTWSLMGIAYAHLNQAERSLNAFRQAANLAPSEEEHWLNLTRELMELNRYPEAVKAAQDGIDANPKSYALHLRLGAAYLSAGRYAESESVFRQLVKEGDPLPTSYIGLAQVLMRTGRPGEAAAELADAEKQLGPKFLLSYFRGLALDRAGKPPEALAAFREAVQLGPDSAEAHLNLGKTELAQGQVKPAIAELQNAFRLDSGNRQTRRLLSQAYRRSGDMENATKFAESTGGTEAAVADNLLGDFIIPQWQVPPAQ